MLLQLVCFTILAAICCAQDKLTCLIIDDHQFNLLRDQLIFLSLEVEVAWCFDITCQGFQKDSSKTEVSKRL